MHPFHKWYFLSLLSGHTSAHFGCPVPVLHPTQGTHFLLMALPQKLETGAGPSAFFNHSCHMPLIWCLRHAQNEMSFITILAEPMNGKNCIDLNGTLIEILLSTPYHKEGKLTFADFFFLMYNHPIQNVFV